ncbi:MAG: bifunctional metallophosphatase/5'-nucleotidase [Clostridia bacterium]|nr:bifunctional metallophosphatase/5'-nucleotidase [Clostridia bacterium]
MKTKRMTILSILCLILALFPAWAEGNDAPALQKDVVILFTSDVHCAVDQGWGYGGIYAVRQSFARDNHVLLVDDGDAIQGETIGLMTKGEAVVDIMNAVGYDIAIPGNHEFDYGLENFLALAERADYPYISCNFNKGGELVLAPYVIETFDGVQIAFVGVTTPLTIRDATPGAECPGRQRSAGPGGNLPAGDQ